LQQQEKINRPSEGAFASVVDVIASFSHFNQQWLDWVRAANDGDFVQILSYKNTSGQPFSQPVYQILLHLFNHSTYHRGQLVTMLHQLEFTSIPATDFLVFTRS